MNIDYVYHVDHLVKPGETIRVKSRDIVCGGKGLNQAIALAKAGLDVTAAGFTGEEGQILRDIMKESGVNTDYIQILDRPNGHTVIQVDAQGNNNILYYPSTNEMFSEDMINTWLDLLDKDDVLVLQNEANLVPYMISSAYEKGIRVCLNPSPVAEDIRDYPLEKCTWIFINETEGETISGYADPQDIMDFFAKKYPGTQLILTLGETGAWYSYQKERVFCEAFRVEAIDTTAAGDTFTGYFLQAEISGKDSMQALKQACAASALAVTRNGAAPSIPWMEEVMDFMK